MSLPLTSKLPPNCGLVSSDKFSSVTQATGNELENLPEPLGVIDMLPLDTDTIELPLTSKLPPSCGVVSPTISDKPPAAVDMFPNDIFFNEPASAS